MNIEGVPSFLVPYLQRIAKSEKFTDGYDVKHESGSKSGDGYMSTMLSIKLIGFRHGDLKLSELPLICKLQPENVDRQENCASDLIFRHEVRMYNEILPALIQFQNGHNIPNEFAFTSFPKCYAAFHKDGSSESVIIMEDLRAAGFEMWHRKKPTDFTSSRLVMEQIGRLHGLSLAIRDQKPDLFQEFHQLSPVLTGFFAAPGVALVIKSSFTQAIALMDNSMDKEAVERLGHDFKQICLDGLDVDMLGNYGVLCHGDCWINNMMFAMEKGSARSIALLDWQLSRVSSPAIDLTYYLLSSMEKPLRIAHLNELLSIYYKNLAQVIRSTGSEPDELFPEAELQRQLQKFGLYGIAMSNLLIPLILAADTEDTFNLDEMTDMLAQDADSMDIIKNMSNVLVKERIKEVLSDARQYGWL